MTESTATSELDEAVLDDGDTEDTGSASSALSATGPGRRRTPPSTRVPVLSDTPKAWAERMRKDPGEWFIIAAGDLHRLGVFAQTAYRIREGKMAAFRTNGTKKDGMFEAKVSTASNAEDREAPVELWARWVRG